MSKITKIKRRQLEVAIPVYNLAVTPDETYYANSIAVHNCSSWWASGKFRAHNKEWIRANLQKLWDIGARHLVFQDDCLTCDMDAAYDLCDILDDFSFGWMGTTRADKIDKNLAKRLKECGCYELAFGIESGSPTILQHMNKMIDLESSFTAREACKEAGIWFTALVMSGFPYENAQTRAEDAAFRAKLQADFYGSVGSVWVFPGTALYQWCKKAGLINDDFWLGPQPYYVYQGGL